MKKKMLKGVVATLAVTTLVVGGVTAFAATNYNSNDEIAVEEEQIDYGSLSQEEINKLNSIYDRMDALDEEYAKLDEEALALEVKAGWYGDLTLDEVNRLYAIYDRFYDIEDEIYGDDEELSDEEYEARYSKFQDEIDKLDKEATALEEKAGW